MLGRSLWAHCETWFLFFFVGAFPTWVDASCPRFFFNTGHLETVGYASWTCFFFKHWGTLGGCPRAYTSVGTDGQKGSGNVKRGLHDGWMWLK